MPRFPVIEVMGEAKRTYSNFIPHTLIAVRMSGP